MFYRGTLNSSCQIMDKRIFFNLFFLAMFLGSHPAYSRDTGKDSLDIKNGLNSESLGIGDLVIDHTRSKWGRDFVDLFNRSWNPPPAINDYTIVIEEKPLPRLGTVILIKVNGDYIYRRFIQPRYENIKMNAEQGTQIVLSYLINYQQIQKELQGEDLKGTGIY